MAQGKRQLFWLSAGFWVLLLYIIAALVWWYIALQQQNNEMMRLRLQLSNAVQSGHTITSSEAADLQQRKQAQYIGEGAIFLALILVGAFLVYRAIRSYIKLSQQQQTFMMAVTHELKTPIAVTRLQLETLQKHQLPPEQAKKILSQAISETERLNDLCNNILFAAQLSGNKLNYSLEPCDLNLLVSNWTRSLQQRFPSHNFNIENNTVPHILGEENLLQILFNNLIDNAIKYSPRNSTIHIAVLENDAKIKLLVSDEGAGIPKEEKELIFEKFYRIGHEATRKTKGTGLGLYLVKRIAKLHQANVFVSDNKPAGSIFTVEFLNRNV